MAPNRIIIDTDPGVDDVLAMLLALSVNPDELEVAMISVTYGNVELQSCLKNAVALFHVLEKELIWRKENGKAENFGTLKTHKPIIAVGAEHPLEDDQLMADYFHGVDGLHGVHTEHPHLDAEDTWKSLFHKDSATLDHDPSPYSKYFTASKEPAHKEILRLLRESPKDTLTLIAVGPMTNFALAAAEDPETFLKAKEVLVMGGAVNVEGNITPVAEFNTYADTVATARVFALTSPCPKSTMPPLSQTRSSLPAARAARGHSHRDSGSGRAACTSWTPHARKVGEASVELSASTTEDVDVLTLADAPGDDDGWLNVTKGNRINRIIQSPGEDAFAEYLMKRVFA
ncbi:inosine-uridine preferring nucleoside hydrolase [Verticillium alfalfae VaMs.102]|uniref:Inosine-uridine preferring nucleoside hydrolase n=1 Tax=Verticillium alfalfae (strain VaMs.102 / ATCC MYA-4576 / FGSC 10136) TaxID=526221 RepID=C9SM24_VERA1|nr:inosine-uridine preferring nucleoside hydrolase [Verticillium alfalfae VaMs.102]EEY19839.1 inosine-uridine preferring nucleoside hydrolase [Verticillium alfalfae VaMs.102]